MESERGLENGKGEDTIEAEQHDKALYKAK